VHVVHNYSGYNRDGTSVYKLLYFICGYCIDSLLSSLSLAPNIPGLILTEERWSLAVT